MILLGISKKIGLWVKMINDEEDRIVHGGELEYDSLEEAVVDAPEHLPEQPPDYNLTGINVLGGVFIEKFVRGSNYFELSLGGTTGDSMFFTASEAEDAGIINITRLYWGTIQFFFHGDGTIKVENPNGQSYNTENAKRDSPGKWFFLKYYKQNQTYSPELSVGEIIEDITNYINELGIKKIYAKGLTTEK